MLAFLTPGTWYQDNDAREAARLVSGQQQARCSSGTRLAARSPVSHSRQSDDGANNGSVRAAGGFKVRGRTVHVQRRWHLRLLFESALHAMHQQHTNARVWPAGRL